MPLFNLPGVFLPHKKGTAASAPVAMPTPASVLIPLSMHIGAPAVPVVKTGDIVTVGQVIAEAGGFVSAKIHSSVSGKVKNTDTTILSNGRKVSAILIESDGLDTPCETLAPREINNLEDLVAAVKDSGIVGLGGAGFPTAVKLNVKSVEDIVINGAECEPYITSDTRTMIDRGDDIRFGIEILNKCLNPKRIIFGIEKNKPECIKNITNLTSDIENVTVAPLKAMYPQGGEKVLVYHTTGKTIMEGKLPIDSGVIVINCTTLAEIASFVKTGMPLTKKCITIDGGAVAEPKNIIAPIGTRISDIISFAGGTKCEPKKIILGGPMMGWSVESMEMPVMKNTNAVLFFNAQEAYVPEPTACIKCGNCVNACPFGLDPKAFVQALRTGDDDALVELKANICMECGCCSFACPAKRQLVHTNKIAKAKVMKILKERQEAKK